MQPLSIYLHVPFCASKCTYCAFNTYIDLDHLIPAFVEALRREIIIAAHNNPYNSVKTIFFGGGTPSLLTPEQFALLLRTLHEHFDIPPDAEITTETNPNDLDADYLRAIKQAGINRLSMGMQTSNTRELNLFARRHDHATVIKAMHAARDAEYDSINLDLIYGFPQQTLATWEESLRDLLVLRPEHISMYALGLEEGTPMFDLVQTGRLPAPDDDLSADMYDLATDILAENGYQQYEISNWSLPGHECQHNLQYWRNWPYIGLGPGAHGYAAGVRYDTILAPQRYIRAMQEAQPEDYTFPHTPATNNAVQVNHKDEIAETLMMNLRLIREGVRRDDFQTRFGVDLVELHRETLERFAGYGMVEITPEVVRITQQGRLLSNAIFRELV